MGRSHDGTYLWAMGSAELDRSFMEPYRGHCGYQSLEGWAALVLSVASASLAPPLAATASRAPCQS